MMTTTDAASIAAIERAEAMTLAATEYGRFEELLASLSEADWASPTPDCPAWTVSQMVAHVIGGCMACTSMREMIRQQRGAMRLVKDPAWTDPSGESHPSVVRNNAMNEFQIRERAGLERGELLAAFRAAHPKALAGRARKPRILKLAKMPWPDTGSLSLGDLFRIIFTRDTWMHRADIVRATGREMHLTAEHDGRLVADAVAQWARLHAKPFTLTLTGPAGGTFAQGQGGETLTLDAVEFCRLTSGRGAGDGLLATTLPW